MPETGPDGLRRLRREPLMANTPAALGTIKIIPDMSEFAARLTHEISLDDPLARAILDETNTNPLGFRATTVLGERTFALHHWTLIHSQGDEPPKLLTSWIENNAADYLLQTPEPS